MKNKRITGITARNLKGQSFTHNLSKVTVFAGANESGKTARFDAILLAQLGYKLKPGQKPQKTAAAIFRSCGQRGGGGTTMSVMNAMNDGTAIARTWTMKRGKITYEGPEESYIPPTMLDPSGFFALTGPEKRNLVLSQVDLAELGIGVEPLLKKLCDAIQPGTKDSPTWNANEELGYEVAKQAHKSETEKQSIYDWLTATVDAITALRDKEAKLVDTHEQTVRGITDNKAAEGDMTALQSVQPEINAARERQTAAVAAEATALVAFSTAQRNVQDTKAIAAGLVDETATLEAIKVQESKIADAQGVPEPGRMPKSKVMSELRPTSEDQRVALNRANNALDDAIHQHRATTAAVESLIESIAKAKAKTTCPTCGHDVTEQQAAVVANLEGKLADARLQDAKTAEIASHADKAVKEATSAWTAAENAIATWDSANANLQKQNQEAMDDYNARARAYNRAQADINTAREAIRRHQAALNANATAREAAQSLPGLEHASQAAAHAYAAAKAALAPIAEEIRQLEARQKQFIARTQNERLANQSREQLKIASERLAVFKAAMKVVAEEKVRAEAEAFNALLKHARKMTDGNLKAPLEFKDGDLGMTHDGNWIDIGEFSGKQQIFALAGLGLALTQKNDGVRIVLVDECGRLDRPSKHALVRRLLELIHQGVIDQAVLADVNAADYTKSDDVSVITVDAAGSQA